jgi:putative transposase
VEYGMPLTHVARHQGIELRTAQRWLARYRREGFAGLARRSRRDRGQRHRLQPELQALIEGLALRKPPPTAALVHRQVSDVARRNGWPVPHYKQVYRVIKQLEPALLTLAHEGSKAYRLTYDLLYRHEAENPNDLWQADHTLLDIWGFFGIFRDLGIEYYQSLIATDQRPSKQRSEPSRAPDL